MLQILQGCFPRSEDLRIFSMLRLQYVLLVFYETHKKGHSLNITKSAN